MATHGKPVDLIVRRGALWRFHKLKKKTAAVPVKVSWDRRRADRRSEADRIAGDRRKNERRQQAPFTWELGDFLVVE
jgi:hypothetical protein